MQKWKFIKYKLPQLSNEDWAYIAGFWDGEASIGWSKAYKYRPKSGKEYNYFRAFISMTHTNGNLLKWLQAKLREGRLYFRPINKRRNLGKKDQWQYIIYRQETVYKILKMILPYLKDKKEKAQLVLNKIEAGGGAS